MQLQFGDEELKRLAYEPASRMTDWPVELTRSYRRLITVIASAADEQDLRALRSLRVESLNGSRSGDTSLWMDRRHRLIARFHNRGGSPIASIEAIEQH